MTKPIGWMYTFRWLLAVAMTGMLTLGAQGKGPMAKLVDGADIIAIGTAQVSPVTSAGASVSLLVTQYIKGMATPRLTFHVPVREDPRTSNAASDIGCSVWFLRKDEANLTALVSGPLPGIWGFYYSVPSCDATRLQTPLDTVVSVLGAAVEASNGKDRSFSLLFRFVNSADSSLVGDLTNRFRSSSNEDVKRLGLTWAILQGDASALTDMRNRLQTPRVTKQIADLPTALAAYANLDPAGIDALGGISSNRELPLVLRRAATYALRNLHAKETIPHLANLLDDKDLRHLAVSGFIYYRLSVPNLAGNTGRIDISVEKATRLYAMSGPDPVEKEAMRLGPVGDPSESQRIADYWKSWYRTNQAIFDSPK